MMTRHNAIWCFFTIFCLLSVVPMSLSLSEQGIVIVDPDPPSFTVNLTGGDIHTENITVRWTGENPVNCTISTNITSDCGSGEGINVNYSDSLFNLIPNVDYTVEMTIKAAINIMQGNYTIITNFSCTEPENIPPIANFTYSPSNPVSLDFIQFTDTSTDLDGIIVNWTWDFGDGHNSTEENPIHQYADDGIYTVALNVTDDDGATNEISQQINVGSPTPSPPSPPGPGPVNIPPLADASAGELYTGYVGEEIIFDGSNSSDIDGTITEWFWDFGDGGTGTGETTNHSYSNPGTYNVTLTVKDDDGDTGTYKTVAIIKTGNRLPTAPIINGTMLGNKTVEYNYTAVSTDPDNDTIRYFFDWDDGVITISGFLASGMLYNKSHDWMNSGVYTITVYAEDINGGVSGTTEMTVFIDVQFIDDVIQGYLLDTNDDGIYDIFHNNATGNETTVELQDNGNYLIDSDGDTIWDYEYSLETSMLDTYPLEEEEEAIILWLIALIAMVAISVIIFAYFIHLKKKEKDKEQKKKKKAKSKKEK